jgi:hypothetical protein
MGKLTDSMLHWLDSFEMLAFDSMPHPQFRHLAEACGGTICHHVTELTREDLGRAARIQLLDITGNQCTLFSGLPFDSKVPRKMKRNVRCVNRLQAVHYFPMLIALGYNSSSCNFHTTL